MLIFVCVATVTTAVRDNRSLFYTVPKTGNSRSGCPQDLRSDESPIYGEFI